MKKVNLGKKEDIWVSVFLDVKDPDSPTPLTPDEESKLDKTALPENILELKSRWARPTFTTLNVIEMNQYVEKIVQGRVVRVFDSSALVLARIRVLLKEWNLTEIDSNYKLDFVDSIDSRGLKILGDATMSRIGEIDPPVIMNIMYNKATELLFPEEARMLKKLMENQRQENPTT